MDNQTRTKIKNKLEEELKQTRKSISNLLGQSSPVAPDNAIGRLSRMDALVSQGISENALNSARLKERKLLLALSNINAPGFGHCTDCGVEISEKRLLLMPEVRICIECARPPDP